MNQPSISIKETYKITTDQANQEESKTNSKNSSSSSKLSIVFVKIFDSANYFKSFGDSDGKKMLENFKQNVSSSVLSYDGAVIKAFGDLIKAYFINPKDAILASIDIQKKFSSAQDSKNQENRSEISVKICVHLANVYFENGSISGNALNISEKLIELVKKDQIWITGSVYEAMIEESFFPLEKINIEDKGFFEPIEIYNLIWSKIEQKHIKNELILIYLKPLWSLADSDFINIWNNLIDIREGFWGDKIIKEQLLEDKSLYLVAKNTQISIDIITNMFAYIKRIVGINYFFPVQIIINSAPTNIIDKWLREGFEIEWEQIEPSEIYISPGAYEAIKNKKKFQTEPAYRANSIERFYKLIIPENAFTNKKKSLFIYNTVLAKGKHYPCYYCGSKKHLALNCPSKQIDNLSFSLKQISYLSIKKINNIFFNLFTGNKNTNSQNIENIENMENIGGLKNFGEDFKEFENNNLNNLAHDSFYELKYIYQIRAIKAIWDSNENRWDKAINKSYLGRKNSANQPAWLAIDCIRVSNLKRAQEILETSLEKNSSDYKIYFAIALLYIERNNFFQAQYYLNQALYYALSNPQKIIALFFLSRLHYLNGNLSESEKMLGEILSTYSRCTEASYQNIVFNFQRGFTEESLVKLVKFIRENREYFIIALIDPDIAPFSEMIHKELKKLLTEAKEKADFQFLIIDSEFRKLKSLLEDKSKQKDFENVEKLFTKINKLYLLDSYIGYLDVIHYSQQILPMIDKIINERKKVIYNVFSNLDEQCQKRLIFTNTYPYKNFVNLIESQLKSIQEEGNRIKNLINFDTAGIFKRSLDYAVEFSKEISKIDAKISFLETILKIRTFVHTFFRYSIIIQSLNILLGLVLFPGSIYLITSIFLELKIPFEYLWFYVKGFLGVGGIFGVIIALIMTINKLYPD